MGAVARDEKRRLMPALSARAWHGAEAAASGAAKELPAMLDVETLLVCAIAMAAACSRQSPRSRPARSAIVTPASGAATTS